MVTSFMAANWQLAAKDPLEMLYNVPVKSSDCNYVKLRCESAGPNRNHRTILNVFGIGWIEIYYQTNGQQLPRLKSAYEL